MEKHYLVTHRGCMCKTVTARLPDGSVVEHIVLQTRKPDNAKRRQKNG